MELHAMTDDINDLFFFVSTFYMTYFFFSTFYINHNLPFMNDEGFVPLFTRVTLVNRGTKSSSFMNGSSVPLLFAGARH